MTEVTSKATTISPVVRAANDLTARWCATLDGGDAVLSGAGLWPLLALLASAADESAGAELAAALGRPADSAQQDALELIDLLRTGESTSAALGLWVRKGISLQPDWASGLPEVVVGTLTDQEALDRWAAEATDGLIEKFPLEINAVTAMVLASALTARVKWWEPFDARPRNGNWETTDLNEQWLSRTSHDLTVAALLDDAVTRVNVEGNGDLDVHLLVGDQHPGEVLSAGLRELCGEAQVRPVAESDSGRPGLHVRRVESSYPADILRLELPGFEIKAHHDLLKQADLFGLRSVTDPVVPHLPRLSPAPLYVSNGVQDVVARFSAGGFEASAATSFGTGITGGIPEERYQVTCVDVILDRSFGFIAVHRTSGLAVVAGWVGSPFRD